jgi:hypothetical protein
LPPLHRRDEGADLLLSFRRRSTASDACAPAVPATPQAIRRHNYRTVCVAELLEAVATFLTVCGLAFDDGPGQLHSVFPLLLQYGTRHVHVVPGYDRVTR